MEINAQTLITLASVIGAIGVFAKLYNKCYDLVRHQAEQDKKIESLSADNQAVLAALLGILDGQIEQGCNGAVHKAREELQKHILGGRK